MKKYFITAVLGLFFVLMLTYSGTAPNAYVDIETDNSELANDMYFSTDQYNGLSNGDTVTVTCELYGSEEYFAEEHGMLPSVYEKTYTVEGVPFYISSSDQIPDDLLEKMKSQTEDVIVSTTSDWDDGWKINAKEYIGNYFLAAKSADEWDQNYCYIVYKITASTELEDDSDETMKTSTLQYYYYCRYTNIEDMGDGTVFVDVTDYDDPWNSFKFDTGIDSGWWTYTYYFDGYETIDEIYKVAIAENIADYSYEDNMTE